MKGRRRIKILVFVVGYVDKDDEFCFTETEGEEDAHLKVFESKLQQRASWFSRLGYLQVQADERGPYIRADWLMDMLRSWEDRGAPKIQGEGKSASPASKTSQSLQKERMNGCLCIRDIL